MFQIVGRNLRLSLSLKMLWTLSFIYVVLLTDWRLETGSRTKVYGTVLQPFVDVKGNGALRDVRIMYDLYGDTNTGSSSSSTSDGGSKSSLSSSSTSDHSGSTSSLNLDPNEMVIDSKSPSFPYYYPHYHHQHTWQNSFIDPATSITSPAIPGPHHSVPSSQSHTQSLHQPSQPQPYLQSSQSWSAPFYIPGPTGLIDRFKLKNVRAHPLIRGRPMFAEIDFVPKYIPQNTHYMAISVTLPAHIRGRSWILGWHQEVFPLPLCRLCTNNLQSFTLPVTLFLPDDGWCPEGRVPTIWKVEAITRESNARLMDQTDMTVAFGYDQLRQIYIGNDPNTTVHCRGINEAIVA